TRSFSVQRMRFSISPGVEVRALCSAAAHRNVLKVDSSGKRSPARYPIVFPVAVSTAYAPMRPLKDASSSRSSLVTRFCPGADWTAVAPAGATGAVAAWADTAPDPATSRENARTAVFLVIQERRRCRMSCPSSSMHASGQEQSRGDPRMSNSKTTKQTYVFKYGQQFKGGED